MANAIPVHSKSKKKEAPQPPTVTTANPETKPEDLLARAQAVVATEIPEVLDEQVNQIGQAGKYGNIKSVTEQAYDVLNRKGEPTGEVRYHTRIDH